MDKSDTIATIDCHVRAILECICEGKGKSEEISDARTVRARDEAEQGKQGILDAAVEYVQHKFSI